MKVEKRKGQVPSSCEKARNAINIQNVEFTEINFAKVFLR